MKQNTILKNYIYKLVYQIITFLIPLITMPYLSKIFEPDGVGIYSYTGAITGYFLIFAAMGTEIYGVVEISKNREDSCELSKTFWEIICTRIITSGISIFAWMIVVLISNQYKTVFLVQSLQIVAILFDVTWFYEGLENYRIIVVRNTIIKVLSLFFLVLFIKQKEDLAIYIASIGIFAIVGNLSLWLSLRKYIHLIHVRQIELKKHIRGTMVYFIPTIATSIYTLLDKAMIGWITGDEAQNGYYEQANGIITLVKKAIATLPIIMRPRMTFLANKGETEEFKDKLIKSIDFIMFLSIFSSFLVFSIAEKFIPWYLGEEFHYVYYLLLAKSVLLIFISLSMCISEECITPIGRRGRANKIILLGSAINLLLNCVLIPTFKAIGAAAASVAAEIIICSLYGWLCKDYISFKLIISIIKKKVIAGVVMCLVIMIVSSDFQSNYKTTIFQIAIGGITYCITLILLRDSIWDAAKSFLVKEKNK